MSILTLNCVNPEDPKWTHRPQAEFLQLDYTGGMKRVHFISGRGGGKTLAAVLLAFRTLMSEPGTRGVVFAPTFAKLRDIYLVAWEDIVPGELYTVKRSEMAIIMANGSQLLMRSRHVDNPRRGRDVARGLDVNFVIDDEAAEGFDLQTYTNISACIRRAGNHRYYACMTTPVLNAYRDLANRENHVIIRSSSRDNPHLPADWVDELASQMSKQQVKREIDGQDVALEGLVWPEWSDKQWPAGNVHEHEFDSTRPWFLFLDLGVGNGAYIVMQQVEAELFTGYVWVACAEVTPVYDGSASHCFQLLDQYYGTPAMVVAGADINTRSQTDARTPAWFVNQQWGPVPVRAVSGWKADKQVQYNRASYLICDANDRRRFCISRTLKTLAGDKSNRRGLVQLFEQDTWPENVGKVRGVLLEKEGRLEHVRDALLYGAVELMSPPQWGKTAQRAA